jgi:hypothetical protein
LLQNKYKYSTEKIFPNIFHKKVGLKIKKYSTTKYNISKRRNCFGINKNILKISSKYSKCV